MVSVVVSFVLSFFPRGVLDGVLGLIESVSEDFPSYSFLWSTPDLRHFSRKLNHEIALTALGFL